MAESSFQSKVKADLKGVGGYVLIITTHPGIPNGCPDIIALFDGGLWFALECKTSAKAKFQPLQQATIAKLDRMGYSRVIYPENWDEVFAEIKQKISSK